MKKISIILLMVLAIVMCMSLISHAVNLETLKNEPKPDKLNVLYVGVEANVKSMEYAAEKYEKLTGIEIKIDSFPQTAMREKLFSELSSRSSYYDVILVDGPWAAPTAPHLMNLLPLVLDNELTDPELFAEDDFIPMTMAQVVYDQENPSNPPMDYQLPEYAWKEPLDIKKLKDTRFELIGIPFHPNVLILAYRKDYFEDPELRAKFKEMFGRELTPPEDWDEFVEVAKFFTKSYNPDSPTEYGTTLMAKKHESLYCDWRTWNRTFGVVEINTDMEPTFNNEKGIEATTFYKKLIKDYKVTPPGVLTWTWDEVTTSFSSGQTAMAMNYHRMTLDPEIKEKGGEAGFVAVPGERQADGSVMRAPHYGTYFLAVNKYSKNPRWAYDFILHAASPQWQKEYAPNFFHSSRKSYYEDPEVIATRPEYWPDFYKSLQNGYARPRLTCYVEYSETIQEEVSKYLIGEQSVEEALDKAAARIKELFKRNRLYDGE